MENHADHLLATPADALNKTLNHLEEIKKMQRTHLPVEGITWASEAFRERWYNQNKQEWEPIAPALPPGLTLTIAQSGNGKTTFARHWSTFLARQWMKKEFEGEQRQHVVYVDAETTLESWTVMQHGFSYGDIIAGKLDPDVVRDTLIKSPTGPQDRMLTISKSAADMRNHGYGSISAQNVETIITRLVDGKIIGGQDIKVGAIFVDYLNQLDASDDEFGKRYQIMTERITRLRNIGLVHGIPIVVLMQANLSLKGHDGEHMKWPMPSMKDGYESQGPAQRADAILGLMRPLAHTNDVHAELSAGGAVISSEPDQFALALRKYKYAESFPEVMSTWPIKMQNNGRMFINGPKLISKREVVSYG